MIQSEMQPLVSIGMPVYNGEKLICEALDSLLAQDFKNFELIISDNASTDRTAEICKMYIAHDSRIRYYRNERNMGFLVNFNMVMLLAQGKYFMWAADDDSFEPSYISCMVDALDNNSDAVLSFCRFDNLYKNKPPFEYNIKWSKVVEGDRFHRLIGTCFQKPWVAIGCYSYGLIRKEVLIKIGGYDTRLGAYGNIGVDIIVLFHLLYYGKFITVDKILYHRRCNIYRHDYVKETLGQKLAKRSLYSMVKSKLKSLNMWHHYYSLLRIVVKETSLPVSQKFMLYISLYVAEILYYIHDIKISIR